MSNQFDLKRLLAEIQEDEDHSDDQEKVRVNQRDIARLLALKRKSRPAPSE